MIMHKLRERVVVPDLGDAATTSFIVDNLIERNSLTVIAAAPGTGKTAVSMHMSKCITEGTPFFGMEIMQRTKCAFVQFDMSVEQHTAYNRIFAPGCPIAVIPGSVFVENDGDPYISQLDLGSSKVLADIVSYCKAEDIGVLFVDTLSTAFPLYDENSNNVMTRAMTHLKLMAHQGIAVITLHHVAKSEHGYGTATRGASAITGCVDNEIKLVETSNGNIEMRQTKTRTSKKGLRAIYSISGDGITDCGLPLLETDGARIVSAFENSSGEMTRKEIVASVKMSTNALQKALDTLVVSGVLHKGKSGKADVYTLMNKEELVDKH
jgi:hypothetical protein